MNRFATTLAVAALALAPSAALSAEVVATVGDTEITREALEDSVRPQLLEIDNQRFEVLSQGLEQLIATKLMEAEAASRGTSLEDLQKSEILDKISEPTDEEMREVYDANAEQLQGQDFESLKPAITGYLKNQKSAERMQAFLTELRAKYPTKSNLLPPRVEVGVGAGYAKGPADAPITMIAFSDYECPFCKRAEATVKQVLAAYPDKIRYIHRDYPLPFHKNANKAAQAARCAGVQGKFWEYYDGLWESERLTEKRLDKIAEELTLDAAAFTQCLGSGQFAKAIETDMTDGQAVGVSGTPAFFINGRMLSGAQPMEAFKAIIDAELAAAGGQG